MEDRSFNEFLKARLEDGIEVPSVRLPRTGNLWRRPLLMAASLAVLCGIFTWQLSRSRDARLESHAVSAIEFLEECEGLEVYAADSFAEKLLIWQDAPFTEIAEM